MSKTWTKRAVSPSVKDRATVDGIMLDVLVALTPALCMGAVFYGIKVLVVTAISVGACMGFEWLYNKLTGKANTLRDLSACVTGLLLAMSLPATVPYWAPVLGGAFAIVVVKQFYGGLGKNFMNPALAGRMLLLSFPGMMTTWVDALDHAPLFGAVDAVSTATPMAYFHLGQLPPQDLPQMLLGQHAGAMGEVACFMLLLGGLYLLARRVISWRIPGCFLGTVAVLSFCFPRAQGVARMDWMLYNLLGGGLLLGAIFMATDYTTSPVTPRGQMLYGVGCGCLTVALRCFGSYPDGVGFAILTMNCCVWLLDRIGLPRRFGVPPLTETRLWLRRQGRRLAMFKPVLPQKKEREPGAVPGEKQLDAIRQWQRSALSLALVIVVTVVAVFSVQQGLSRSIALRENRQQQELLSSVMPLASVASETPYVTEDAVRILAGYNEVEQVGYCIEVEVQGFGGMITMVVGVDLNGEVTGVSVTDHSEHATVGGQATQPSYLVRYRGMSGTIRHEGANSVDAISGATDTCHAITAGVNKALYIATHLEDGDVQYVDGDV